MSAFTLGVLVIIVNLLCEITNICYVLSLNSVEKVLANFVAFKVLIEAQDFYAWQRSNFRIRQAVVPNPLIIIEDKSRIYQVPDDDQLEVDRLGLHQKKKKTLGRRSITCLYVLGKLIRVYYTSFYYYFFPLLIGLVPFSIIILKSA